MKLLPPDLVARSVLAKYPEQKCYVFSLTSFIFKLLCVAESFVISAEVVHSDSITRWSADEEVAAEIRGAHNSDTTVGSSEARSPHAGGSRHAHQGANADLSFWKSF